MHPFEHFAPTSLDEAIALLNRYGETARILAGGTDLLVFIKQRRVLPNYVIELSKVPGLAEIEQCSAGLRIGACVRLREIERSELIRKHHPHLAEAAGEVGSVQIRNLATIGGNVCTASPAGDTIPALMVSNAVLYIRGPSGERTVPIEQFFRGPGQTVLAINELLTAIELPSMPSHSGSAFIKLGIRHAMDISIANVAVVVALSEDLNVIEEARIALGSVAPTVIRARTAERKLHGARITDDIIEDAAHAAMEDAQPITDHRASAQYRRLMVAVLTKRALKRAIERARGAVNET